MSRQFIETSPVLGDAGTAQVSAQDTSVSVWVAASAGAGKTRVLTNRMLRLLLEGAKPAAILALTYTRAAAKEMATRLIDQARDLASMSEEERQDAVAQLLGQIPDGSLVRARGLYEEILETPGGLQIQTIHSFCQSLLGRFPFEAGLTPGFEPVEDAARAQLLREALDEALRSKPQSYGKLKAMIQVDKLPELAEALVRVDWEECELEERLAALEEALGGGLAGKTERSQSQQFKDDLAERRGGLDALFADCAAAKTKTPQTFAAACQAAMLEEDPFAQLFAAVMTKTGGVKANLAKCAECIESETFEWLIQRLERQQERLLALRLYELNLEVLAFGQAVTRTFQQLKAAKGVLDFNDLIAGANRLLGRAGGPTYVQYRLDQQISHILLDEAQDTSRDQWALIDGLAKPFFEDASGMEDRPRTLFVVGDFKQSIYSFQGAKPQLFQEKRQAFQTLAGDRLRPVEMVHSFRSAPAILGFVDAVAARLRPGDEASGLEGAAGPMPAHAAVQQARQGRVEIWPAPSEGQDAVGVQWQPLREAAKVDSPRARLGKALAKHIHRLCYDATWADKPDAYLATGRRVQPGDFLILLQNRKAEFADALIAELKALRVPVTGVDRLKVAKELLVQDLLALGDICLQPGDDLALAALLKSPFYGLSEQALYDLAIDRGSRSLMAQLADQRPELHSHFLRLRGDVGRRSVYEFYAAYLFSGGMRARTLAALGPEVEDILAVFLDRARAFDQTQNGDLLGFIEAERASTQELKRDSSESAGEVRLMTVHGAKGLEAPIVIMPDLRDPSRTGGGRTDDQILTLPNVGPVWVPKKEFDAPVTGAARATSKAEGEAERERLFYVALTRAEERLIIATDQLREDKGDLYTWFNKAWDVAGELGEEDDLDLEALGWSEQKGRVYGTHAGLVSAGMDATTPELIALPSWIKSRLDPLEKPQEYLSPSRMGEGEDRAPRLAPQAGGRAHALLRGTLIHAALEHLPGTPPPSWEGRLSKFFASAAPDVEREILSSWVNEVCQALESKDLAAFFGPHSRAELNISGSVDGQPALGQIDRLWVDENQCVVHILDYKTNRPPPTDPADVSPTYVAQLRAYAALVQPLYPNHKIRTYLFWTHTTTLMEVTHAALTGE